jgi:cobalt-zinc-cadmium efflux system outer membrane protein
MSPRILWAILIFVSPKITLGQGVEITPASSSWEQPSAAALPLLPLAPGDTDNPTATELSLADLEAIALEHNPTLNSALARINAARGGRVQAGLYPNPVIGYHATEAGVRGTAGQQGGFIAQRFVTGGKLRLDQSIASMQVNESRYLFEAQKLRVLSDVRLRFYDALVAQRRVELTRELARIGDDLVSASEKLLDARQISENDRLQAEIEADEAHIFYDNAQNETVAALQQLSAVVGVPTMQQVALSGNLDADLPSHSWEECYGMLLLESPELEAARTRIDRARFSLRRAEREPIPDVDLSVSVRHHNVTKDDVANIQLGIPIPIFNRNQGNISKAQAEWIAANNDVKRIELDLQQRLAVAYRRYANARQQANRYLARILPRARRSLNLVKEGYDEGQVDYLTVLTSQRTFVRVNLSYLDSVQELWSAALVIKGQLLSGSLASAP